MNQIIITTDVDPDESCSFDLGYIHGHHCTRLAHFRIQLITPDEQTAASFCEAHAVKFVNTNITLIEVIA